eukprot:11202328-Lingulodinium_polyedra.AAC.1
MKERASSTDYSQMAETMNTSEFRTLTRYQRSFGRTGAQRATRGRTAYGVEEDTEVHEDERPTAPAYVAAEPEE